MCSVYFLFSTLTHTNELAHWWTYLSKALGVQNLTLSHHSGSNSHFNHFLIKSQSIYSSLALFLSLPSHLMSLSYEGLSILNLVWWEIMWFQRANKSKLPPTLFFKKGWRPQPKTRPYLSMPTPMMLFTFNSHCHHLFMDHATLIQCPLWAAT